MRVKADLHIHSMFSKDAISRPESVLSAAADRGIGLIAITDHDSAEGWDSFLNASKKYPVAVIPGQEIKIYNKKGVAGELICLFLEKPIQNKNVDLIIQEVKNQGGLVSIAHPFCQRRGEFRAFADINDWDGIAIEVMNGRTYNHRDNEMAQSLATRLDTTITAGSDAHSPFEVGNVYLEFSGTTPDDLKKAILNKDVKSGGHISNPFFSFISGFGRLGLAV